jgi:acyl dehydratase
MSTVKTAMPDVSATAGNKMARIFASADDMLAAQSCDLGKTDWMELTQQRIDQFAEATGDHQWVHVDPARAADGPFGACIAHGYLILSLVSLFLLQLLRVENMRMGVNAGCDRVRFLAPVKAGSLVRGQGRLLKVERVESAQKTVRATTLVTVQIQGLHRPGCVAETISRFTFN